MSTVYPLTRIQLSVLDFIRAHTAVAGVSPSYGEIQHALGMSSRGHVHSTILRLERRGAIVRQPGRARTIRVVDQSDAFRDRVIEAARALMADIQSEEIALDIATIRVPTALLGELDVALAEMG